MELILFAVMTLLIFLAFALITAQYMAALRLDRDRWRDLYIDLKSRVVRDEIRKDLTNKSRKNNNNNK